ncbi:MAG: EAL domain-containing protein [Desulfobulbaceae bacterium]|uniref:EAL domain-containing protein n=1 Tax=Candidatus Desulfobia pelagia TaxID=2841692 RepID=A0A8J6NDV6_9BACT|nr:EAL domain-containing protein [Candidatus Desulfobia pelagia]
MSYTFQERSKALALVVDDDASLRVAMEAALQKAGFEVIEAESGREAIALFQAKKPDLILLDVIMPGMDGFQTCSTIRDLPGGKHVQILMVTGLDDTKSTERAFEVGANDFISKPLNWLMLGHRARYMERAGRSYKELIKSQQRLAKTQKLAKLGNWDINLSTGKFHCSFEARRLLGFENASHSLTFEDFLTPIVVQEHHNVKTAINNAVNTRKPFSVNYLIILPDGSQRHILNQGEILPDDTGAAEIMLGAIQDVSELKLAEEEIRLLAFYDGLTGLANRMLFHDRLEQEISKAKRYKQYFALLFLDLDQFKRINDLYGHHIGDLLLKNVSETLQKCVRTSDTASRMSRDESETVIARFGGDEFIILLPDINEPENAAKIANRILHEIPSTYDLDGHDVSITTSIGISVYPADGDKPDILLRHADSAMYHAKDTGRNNYQFYEESLNAVVTERFSIEKDLRKALEQNEFLLYYQPQINLATRKIVGAEALIRWIHPQKGMIPPDKFIPIAEESGIIIDINKWVIQTACQQNKKWEQLGFPPVRIAVNLSGYQLAHQNLIQTIKEALDAANLDPKNLEVEITENILMQEEANSINILNQIKDLKLRIALDDFGTGYSSLSYLTSFPVDVLKIDRSFVMCCTEQKNNLIIIRAIIAMGHSLGMKIVAEGIETEEQLKLMTAYGVDEAQGYYFKPPVSQEDFVKLLEKGTL